MRLKMFLLLVKCDVRILISFREFHAVLISHHLELRLVPTIALEILHTHLRTIKSYLEVLI